MGILTFFGQTCSEIKNKHQFSHIFQGKVPKHQGKNMTCFSQR